MEDKPAPETTKLQFVKALKIPKTEKRCNWFAPKVIPDFRLDHDMAISQLVNACPRAWQPNRDIFRTMYSRSTKMKMTATEKKKNTKKKVEPQKDILKKQNGDLLNRKWIFLGIRQKKKNFQIHVEKMSYKCIGFDSVWRALFWISYFMADTMRLHVSVPLIKPFSHTLTRLIDEQFKNCINETIKCFIFSGFICCCSFF